MLRNACGDEKSRFFSSFKTNSVANRSGLSRYPAARATLVAGGARFIATNPDVGAIDIAWLDEHDLHVNPLGIKGIGEIGIVGTAAAIANAAYHATGIRVRDLPITLDKFLS